MRKDELARFEQEAVDDQYRFLVGLRPEPAELPRKGELATAAALFAQKLTVRAVAKKMGISVGGAHKLKVRAAAFNVQPHVNMNTVRETALQQSAKGSGEKDTVASQPTAAASSMPDQPGYLLRSPGSA